MKTKIPGAGAVVLRGRPGIHGRPWQWVLSLLMVLFAGGSMLLGVVAAHADDNKTIDMYSASSNLASLFANGMKPDSDQGKELAGAWSGVLASPATAGDLLGYADKDLNPIQWLVSQATASSQALDYDTIGASPNGLGAKHYGEFGATLNALGLDSTATGLGSDLLSFCGGGILLLAYWAASGVGMVFNFALTIMSWSNPFKLLYQGVNMISPSLANGMTGGAVSSADLGPFTGIATFVGGVYKAVSSLSWAVMVPLFIGVTVMGLLLFKPGGQASRGGKIRKLLTRMVFIIIGIPLLGSMYTNVLSSMLEMTSSSNSGATQVVASTFVDFRAWSTQARLAVPSGATIAWDENAHAPTGASSTSVQDSALAINKMVHGGLQGVDSPFSLDPRNSDWMIAPDSRSDATNADGAGFNVASVLIFNYMGHTQVENSGFAGDVQGELTSQGVSAAPDWFKELADGKNTDGQGDELVPAKYPVLNVAPDSGLTADVNGKVVTFRTPSGNRNSSCGAKIVASKDSGAAPLACNMSAMSMYNYLSTDFGDHSLTTYSSEKVSSAATQKKHNAVTIVGGGGVEPFLIWLEAVVILMSFALIGFVYALGMFVGNIRHGYEVLTATPFAMLGALAAITKVIVFAVAMVLEILGTLFLFQIVQQLIIALPRTITHFVAQIASGLSWLAVGSGFATVLGLLLPLLLIIVMIMMTITAMRLRKSVIKAINEASTKVIENLVGGQAGSVPGGPGGPGKLGRLAGAAVGGAATGAGMALGGSMMGGSKGLATPEGDGPEAANASGTVDGSMTSGGDPQDPESGDGSGGGSPLGVGPGGGGGRALAGGGSGTVSSVTGRLADSSQNDSELGSHVAQHGLTAMPTGEPGPGRDSASAGQQQSTRGVKSDADDPDVLDTATGRTLDQQKAVSLQKRAVVGETAAAAVRGGLAAAGGMAGDDSGAVQHGAKAAGGAQRAAQSSNETRRTRRENDAQTSASVRQLIQPTQNIRSALPGQVPQRPAQAPGQRSVALAAPARPTPQQYPAPRRSLPVQPEAAPQSKPAQESQARD